MGGVESRIPTSLAQGVVNFDFIPEESATFGREYYGTMNLYQLPLQQVSHPGCTWVELLASIENHLMAYTKSETNRCSCVEHQSVEIRNSKLLTLFALVMSSSRLPDKPIPKEL